MVNAIPSIIFITISALPLVIKYFLKRKYNKLIKNIKIDDNYYHQCMFITMRNFRCKQHLIDRNECSEYCSYSHLRTLLNFISSAQSTISLCVYMTTLKQINVEIVKAHKRGIKIRIITDRVMLKTDVAKYNFSILSQNGIEYKTQASDYSMMHHKFCLIDKDDRNSAKMFFGTMNLTSQGLVSNFESVILTNNWDMIGRFSEEFEELWEFF